MSLSSLVTEEIRRTEPQFLQKQTKSLVNAATTKLVSKLNLSGTQVNILQDEGLFPLATSDPIKPGQASNAFDALARYIPTEAVTLYVAVASAIGAFKETFPRLTEAEVYWFFVIFTPVLFFLIFLGKRREAKLKLFPPIKKWPWWKLIASTIAFAFWALAIPMTPYLKGVAGGTVAAFCALLVSTFLTLLQPIFEDKISKGDTQKEG